MNHKIIIISILVIIVVFLISINPSNHRNWTKDQQVLPHAVFRDNFVDIYNIRNFTYATTSEYTPNYYNQTFNLNNIKQGYFIVEPFSQWKGSAHTFLSFEFEENSKHEFVAVSAEIRKEEGEHFSALKGLFKQYELMYVIGDERDLINLRANYRNDTVYMYPIITTPKKIRALFVSMVERANSLKLNPEFYNTLTNTCTTNIVKHVNTISPHKIPLSLKILAPGYSDQLAYDMGIIPADLPFSETRNYYRINEQASKSKYDDDFSNRIRLKKASSNT